MKKIPTLFERDWNGDRSRVLPEPHPDCLWVFAGEGVATRKYDGTCCLVDVSGLLWKRHEVKPGKTAPEGFSEVAHDEETGKRIGWVPVTDGPEDRWHREAFEALRITGPPQPGTYELVGPKVQGNPERMVSHDLLRHENAQTFWDAPRDYEGLRAFFEQHDVEGLVFHHPDGRMAKIKARDFGIRR